MHKKKVAVQEIRGTRASRPLGKRQLSINGIKGVAPREELYGAQWPPKKPVRAATDSP